MSAPDREPRPGPPPEPEKPTTWRPVGHGDALTARSPDLPVLPGQSRTGNPQPAAGGLPGAAPEPPPAWRHVGPSDAVGRLPRRRVPSAPTATLIWLAAALLAVVLLSLGALVLAGVL